MNDWKYKNVCEIEVDELKLKTSKGGIVLVDTGLTKDGLRAKSFGTLKKLPFMCDTSYGSPYFFGDLECSVGDKVYFNPHFCSSETGLVTKLPNGKLSILVPVQELRAYERNGEVKALNSGLLLEKVHRIERIGNIFLADSNVHQYKVISASKAKVQVLPFFEDSFPPSEFEEGDIIFASTDYTTPIDSTPLAGGPLFCHNWFVFCKVER